MTHYQAQQSAIIDAPADQIYQIIADYHEGHRAILPTRYFTEMVVREGGFGRGTVIAVEMKVLGARSSYEFVVSEPVRGRKLVEEDKTAGVLTSFDLKPVNEGKQTRVTITTEAKTSPGLRGSIEKIINPPITRMIYREELEQLARVAQQQKEQISDLK